MPRKIDPKLIAAHTENWAKNAANDTLSGREIANQSDPYTGKSLAFDARETFHLENELKGMVGRAFSTEFAPLKSLSFVDMMAEGSPGDESISYEVETEYGVAERVADYADDLPSVIVTRDEFTRRYHTYGDRYSLSIFDLMKAAKSGKPISERHLAACKKAIDRVHDSLIASGDTERGWTGLLNDANAASAVSSGAWSAATIDAIIEDCVRLWESIPVATLDNHRPTHLLIPRNRWEYMSHRVTDTNMNVKQYLMANLEGVQMIEPWWRCNTAGAAAATRMVAYEKSPDVLWYETTIPFEQRPPQERNLAFVVNCIMRTAGVVVIRPKAISYMDSI